MKPITLPMPSHLANRLLLLSDAALKNSVRILGGPGSGKSRMLGRLIAWLMFLRCKPLVVLDPTGGVIDNFLDKISRLPLEYRKKLWSRILYVDVGATDYIVPAPLYYRVGATDTLFEVANRLTAIFKRQDPGLQSAPILGWNPLFECAIYAGQIAAALGRQLDFVADLVKHPGRYKEELKQVLTIYPELHPAVTYFRELMDPNNSQLRARRTSSFSTKLIPFLAEPTMLATFAARKRRIDWQQVEQQALAVLIDYRHLHDADQRQFRMLWDFQDFTGYIKHRGMAGRGHEIMLMMDEITQLLGHRTMDGHSILAEDLNQLTAVHARAYGVNVVIAHQNISQLDESVRDVLMQAGTQVIGVTPNVDDALYLARQMVPYDPVLVKKTEPVWMGISTPQVSWTFGLYSVTEPTIIDYRTQEYTPEEQLLLAAQRFQQLGRFEFLVRPAGGEGIINGKLRKISITNLDRNQYPDEAILAPLRHLLSQRDGIPLQSLLAEIQQAPVDSSPQRQKRLKTERTPATIKADYVDPHLPSSNTVSDAALAGADSFAPATNSADTSGDDTDDFWEQETLHA